jgi:hypothetical protein
VWVWHPEALEGDAAWRSALRRAPTCVSNGPRTRLTWTAGGALKVRVQAAPQHRPLRVVIEGPKGELSRIEMPAGEGALDFERDVSVSAGVSWAAARTEGAAPGALDAAAGWSMTGMVRRAAGVDEGQSTD